MLQFSKPGRLEKADGILALLNKFMEPGTRRAQELLRWLGEMTIGKTEYSAPRVPCA